MNARDLSYVKDPGDWVMWPFCPLKRWKDRSTQEFGYLVAVEGQLTTIRKGNMFKASPDDPVGWTYDSAEAMLNAGWRVD